MPKPPTSVYQLKVTLNDTHPRIWRRIRVPGNSTLRKLHDILQIVMGWHDSHLHQFRIGGAYYGAAEYDEGGEMGLQPEQRYRLSQVAPEPRSQFQYEYDFGDGWEHTLLVEKIHPAELGAQAPRCLDGRRACPPEDVGGVWGYQEFLKALSNPRHAEHEAYLAWVGGEFDPDAFEAAQVNAQLRRMRRGRGAEATNSWAADELELEGSPIILESAWAQTLSHDERATAESLPLRRDMISLLAYLRDERVTGTPSTGNLPLKAVHAICARCVHPLKL